MDKIKDLDNTQSWQECGETRIIFCWSLWMSTTTLEKVWQFFTKSHTHLPYDPVVPLLCIYPREMITCYSQKDMHKNVPTSFIQVDLIESSQMFINNRMGNQMVM